MSDLPLTRENIETLRLCGSSTTAEFDALCALALKGLDAGEGKPVAVKPLVWRKPTDHPKDPDADDTLFAADGIGGVYAISTWQKVGPPYLLWWAHDPFDWAGFDSIDAAKAAAQADYETRIRSALIPSPADGAVEALAKEAASAYGRYLDKMQSWECLGEDAKLKEGSFGARELKAHREASELLGIHRGIHKALATLKGDTP